jgi:hypothetical protein
MHAPVMVVLGLSLFLSGTARITAADDHLGLSDEVVPFEDFAMGIDDRPMMITEAFERMLFTENRTREEQIKARSLDDTDTELVDRRSIFGGDRFLSPGPIDPGIEIPTGATLRPYLTIFGSLRSGIQTFDSPGFRSTEWANLLEIYGNVYLSSTERILIGIRPLDREGQFSGYQFGGGTFPEQWVDGFNFDPFTLFIEGDFGEIFPFLDPEDRHSLDYGFSIGRQPVILQDGIMANDNIDSIGITRHNLFLFGASSTRVSAFLGLNDIHRNDNRRDRKARMFALSLASDFEKSTYEIDTAYVRGDSAIGGDGVYAGAGHIRRFGHWNSTLRANASWALDRESAAMSTGWVFTHELSRTMPFGNDLAYLNSYVGVDDYASVARGPATGGPLGRLGLLSRAVGLGRYGAPLGNLTGPFIGAAMGYQYFFDDLSKSQLIVEVGARTPYASHPGTSEGALGARYQRAINRHMVWILGGFASINESGESGYGLRSELLFKF